MPRTSSRPVLVGIALALAGCASASGEGEQSLGVPEIVVDPALPAEVVALTRELIRAGALGDDAPGRVVELLHDRLSGEPGVEVDVRDLGDGRANLRAHLAGSDADAPPLLLVGHAGVAAVDPERWEERAAFEAVVRGEHLVGRGALDMHGPTAVYALALVALARAQVQPARDVILVVTADPEGRSAALERALIDWPELLSAAAALTEGGFILQDFFRAGEEVIAVSRAHKGRLTLEVTTAAVRAPADRPDTATATGRLVHALDRLLRAASTTAPPQVALDTAAALAFASGGSAALLARNRALARGSLERRLAADPFTRNALAHGCAITQLNAADLPSTVPGSASATVVCGVLPGTSPDELRDELLLAIDDPRVRVRVLDAAAPSASAASGGVIDAWRERVRRERAGAPVVPFVLSRPTLAGPLRARGVATWGFAPIRVDRLEHDAIGGPEERVRTRELEDALSRAVDVIAHLSSSAAGS